MRVERPWCFASASQCQRSSCGTASGAAYLRKFRSRGRSTSAKSPPSRCKLVARLEPVDASPRKTKSERCRASPSCHESANRSSCRCVQDSARISSTAHPFPAPRWRNAAARGPSRRRRAAGDRGRAGRARGPPGGRSYTRAMAKAPALPRGFQLPLEQRLPRIGSIDQVAVEQRAAELAKRSIKKDAKVWALELAIRCCDLTTLEGQDTPGKVAALCSKAMRPDPGDPSVPSVAALCVYPNLVRVAKERLGDSGVKVASVATAFPSGQSSLEVKVRDVEEAVALGADEIDM